MVRGTTPTIKYRVKLDTSTITECVISFKQADVEMLQKTYDDVEFSTEMVSVKLTQEETLGFHAGKLMTQIKVKTQDGTVYGSRMLEMKVYEALCCDII